MCIRDRRICHKACDFQYCLFGAYHTLIGKTGPYNAINTSTGNKFLICRKGRGDIKRGYVKFFQRKIGGGSSGEKLGHQLE